MRLESPHLPFASSGRLMRVLSPVVSSQPDSPVAPRESKECGRGRVRPQTVGDDRRRLDLLPLKQLSEIGDAVLRALRLPHSERPARIAVDLQNKGIEELNDLRRSKHALAIGELLSVPPEKR